MKGEIIESLYYDEPNDGWFYIQTNKALYEMRLGGFNLVSTDLGGLLRVDDMKELLGQRILKVLTDDHNMYIELDSGGCLIHGDSFINSEGKVSLGFSYSSKKEYEKQKDELNNNYPEIGKIQ